jgi:hypothetical protein
MQHDTTGGIEPEILCGSFRRWYLWKVETDHPKMDAEISLLVPGDSSIVISIDDTSYIYRTNSMLEDAKRRHIKKLQEEI